MDSNFAMHCFLQLDRPEKTQYNPFASQSLSLLYSTKSSVEWISELFAYQSREAQSKDIPLGWWRPHQWFRRRICKFSESMTFLQTKMIKCKPSIHFVKPTKNTCLGSQPSAYIGDTSDDLIVTVLIKHVAKSYMARRTLVAACSSSTNLAKDTLTVNSTRRPLAPHRGSTTSQTHAQCLCTFDNRNYHFPRTVMMAVRTRIVILPPLAMEFLLLMNAS